MPPQEKSNDSKYDEFDHLETNKEMDHKSDTMTNELLSARYLEDENQLIEEGIYDQVIQDRNHKINTTILRFIDEDQKYLEV